MTLFGDGVTADVIISKEVNRVGCVQYDWLLCEKGEICTQRHKHGRTPCEDEHRDGVMNLQAKQCQGLSQTTRMQGGLGQILPPSPQEEPALPRCDLGRPASSLRGINFCCLSLRVCAASLQMNTATVLKGQSLSRGPPRGAVAEKVQGPRLPQGCDLERKDFVLSPPKPG